MVALLTVFIGLAFLYGGSRYLKDPHGALVRAFPNHYADSYPKGWVVWAIRVGAVWCLAVGVFFIGLGAIAFPHMYGLV